MILAHDLGHLPVGRIYDAADSILAQKLSQVEGVGQVFVGGGARPAVRVQVDPDRLAPARHRARGRCATALRAVNANPPKGELSDATRPWTISANRPALRRRSVPAGDRRLPQRRAGAAGRHRARSRARWRTCAPRASPTASARCCSIVYRQPGANVIETVDRVLGAHAGAARRRSRPRSTSSVVLDRTTSIRASFRDIQLTLLLSIVLVVLVVFVFLRSVSATVIPSVAVPLSLLGHVRRDVPARLQPRQPLADGADHLARASWWTTPSSCSRTSRATSSRGSAPLQAALQGLAGDRLHRAVDDHLAGGGVHPHPPDGRARGPALPRVRGHARRWPSRCPCWSR